MNDTVTIPESQLPEFLETCKKENALAWEEHLEERQDFVQNMIDFEMVLVESELVYRRTAVELKGENMDLLGGIFTEQQDEEKNVWAAFQQVGPVPCAPPKTPSDSGIPFQNLFFPYQGSKIWDWMGPSRRKILEDQAKESRANSEMDTPKFVTPLPTPIPSPDQETENTDAVPSSASSDSGLGSDAVGPTVAKSITYKLISSEKPKKPKNFKVDTPEEIEKRKTIVEEWQEKIRASIVI